MINATYTVVLKTLLDDPFMNNAIQNALKDYPLYEKKSMEENIPSYIPTREELNNKILNHYKYREIAFETPGRFIDELQIAMYEIMPYYNQLFFSLDQDYNILYNVDYTRDTKTTRDGLQKSTGESTNTSRSTSTGNDSSTTSASIDNYNKTVESNTPQGNLDIVAKDIDTVEYADKVSFNHDDNSESGTTSSNTSVNATGESSSNSTGNIENNENEVTQERIKGNYGQVSIQSLIEQYRDLIVNVEQQIINDERIKELFLQIW